MTNTDFSYAFVAWNFICLFSVATAAPVNYSESVDGDLPGLANPLPTLALDAGTNTISGTFGGLRSFDFDSFAFVIPSNMELYFGQLQLFDAPGFFADWELNANSAIAGVGTTLETIVVDYPDIDLIDSVPLSHGTYNLTHVVQGGATTIRPTANFTFTFDVREIVPEPTVPALVSLAVLLALARRSARLRRTGIR